MMRLATFALCALITVSAALGAAPAHVLREFRGVGFEFAFLAWEKHVEAGPEFVTIGGKGTKDQGGALMNGAWDLSAFAKATPYVVVRPGAQNNSDLMSLVLTDAGGNRATFTFSLKGLSGDDFTTVYAIDGATLELPNALSNDKAPAGSTIKMDWSKLKQWQLQGMWTGKLFEVAVKGVYLASDVPESVVELRHKSAQRKEREEAQRKKDAEARAAKIRELLANSPHPADGARVVSVAAVAPAMLGVEIQSGEFKYGSREPYVAQANDKITGGKNAWIVRDGKLVEELVGQKLMRKDASGKEAVYGTLSWDKTWVEIPDRVVGTKLETVTLEETAAYEISSTDDPAFAKPVAPTTVYRKSKPNCPSGAVGGFAILHRVYLVLPQNLKEQANYTVRFKGLNTAQEKVTYVHNPRATRSEAVHASHVGYDAEAPFKRAYLSLWRGTGGGMDYPEAASFELLDATTRKTVFNGKVQVGKANGQIEQMKENKDYAKTGVYWLDFSEFKTPGDYVVYVPGIGTSYPFRVGGNVWEVPFKLSLHGILAQRSSIELGPPVTEFRRPRPYHPDDGVKFYQIDIGVEQGQEGGRGEAIVRLWKQNGKLDEVTGVWGGYQDAGDWDSYTTSLRTAYLLTEAFEVSGAYAAKAKLRLPQNESANAIPDLLDEALWGLDFFKRIQLPDGGVRDGFGDGWGARDGDVSWNNSNPVGVYAATERTSYEYAAAAAKMARLLQPYDAARAQGFRSSAQSAWQWAEGRAGGNAGRGSKLAAVRASAAVELYWLTRDEAFHRAFKDVTELVDEVKVQYTGGWIEPMKQADADFSYARLPAELADAKLQANAKQRFELAALIASHFMQHNSFNTTTAYPGIPAGDFLGYFTAPGGIVNVDVVRAHYVTRQREHLSLIVASTNYSMGANPDNMAMTTGLGPNPIQFPLKLDSRRTGQTAPVGITVYGAGDQTNPTSGWVHTWLLAGNTVPASRTWPAQESYYDVFTWPGCNEFTVDRPMAIAAYTWCYLASLADGR